MQGVRLGMRWWLAFAFVLIAALTAVLIAAVSSLQANRDLQANAESIAVGKTVAAGFAVERAIRAGTLENEITSIGDERGLALFVFSPDRELITQSGLANTRWEDVPMRRTALATALQDRRFVESFREGRATVVSLPLHRTSSAGALVAYAPRPPAYPAANAILRNEVIRASVWAVLIAAAAGIVAAILISRRLRRIATAAQAIEQGDFEIELKVGFPDEIGVLAGTIDGMRKRLGDAFDQLAAERDRFELLLEQLHEGVLAVDRDLRVQFANQNALQLFAGFDFAPGSELPESAVGLPLRRIAERLFASGAKVAEARSRGEGDATLSLVGIPASASDLAVLVVADITEQERRRRAERDFVSNASHELRTPVAAIRGAVEALETGAGSDIEKRERFVRAIGRQADRLSNLTTSLLTLARVQTLEEELQLESVDVLPILVDIAATSVPADGVEVRIDCPGGVRALGRRDVLELVVANLVENALKHTARGDITLAARYTGPTTTIEVSDTGTGIPTALQERVFERFYSADQSRRDGFGLGLAIARDATEAIGGTLTIESDGDRGTKVSVALPRHPR